MAALPADTHVGRVGLAVADVAAARRHYAEVVGLDVLDADPERATLGSDGVALLELTAAPDRPERPPEAAGLYHVAYRVPDRPGLGDALRRAREEWELTGASDHLVSEALYFDDPAGNGVEVYRDRPREEWTQNSDGGVEIDTLPLDLDALSADAAGATGAPPGTDVGHVHLEVTDLAAARAFYVDALGFEVMERLRGALFVAAGGYHHHVGLNAWHGRSAPAEGLGLDWFEVVLPGAEPVEDAADRLADAGYPVERTDQGTVVEDPDGIELRLVGE